MVRVIALACALTAGTARADDEGSAGRLHLQLELSAARLSTAAEFRGDRARVTGLGRELGVVAGWRFASGLLLAGESRQTHVANPDQEENDVRSEGNYVLGQRSYGLLVGYRLKSLGLSATLGPSLTRIEWFDRPLTNYGFGGRASLAKDFALSDSTAITLLVHAARSFNSARDADFTWTTTVLGAGLGLTYE